MVSTKRGDFDGVPGLVGPHVCPLKVCAHVSACNLEPKIFADVACVANIVVDCDGFFG